MAPAIYRYRKSLLTALLFLAYAGAMFWSNLSFMLQSQRTAHDLFRVETEQRAEAVAYYFSERRDDIAELAQSDVVVNFFRNADLGMSYQYGLGVNVQLIEDRFEDMASRKRVGDQAIYSRWLLIDREGEPLASWNRPDVTSGFRQWLADENRDARIHLDPETAELVISAPVWLNGHYRGELLAWNAVGAGLAQFGPAGAERRTLLADVTGSRILASGDQLRDLPAEFGAVLRRLSVEALPTSVELPAATQGLVLVARAAIRDTPLALVAISSGHADGQGPTRLFLIAMAVLPLIVLFVAVLDLRERQRLEDQRERARLEAERLARVRSEFLSNMSHEIRTPLNAVIGLARIGIRENRGGRVGETFARIYQSGEHLLGLVNDVLDFSKIEAGKLQLEQRPFQLLATIDKVLGFVASRAEAKGLSLSVSLAPDLPAWVAGDSLRLAQVLANLLSNAIKFTERGEVVLEAAQDGERIVFLVRDSGIGMSEEQQARLFQPFEQADSSTTRNYGGTGLGLAISMSLAQLMGGSIQVDSRPGAGSSFTLSLPLAPVAPPQGVLTADVVLEAVGPRLAGLSILVADDVEVNRYVIEDLLAREQAHAVFAENGRQALEFLQSAPAAAFDLVLMDVQMPVMDGFEATRRLHALDPELPVIGLTAYALAEERDKCLAAGMVDHVTKPIDEELLVRTILHHARNPAPMAAAVIPGTAAEPAAAAPVWPMRGQVDWPGLSARFKGRTGFVAKLVEKTLESHGDDAGRLRGAAAAGDQASLAFLAHSLKGLGGNLFAEPLQAAATDLEAAVKAGRGDLAALTDRLALELEATLGELAEFAEGQSDSH